MSKVILDSSIFVEAWTLGEYADICSNFIRKYMNDRRKSCYIPIIIPGEVIKNILLKIQDIDRITNILREYKSSFLNKNINFLNIDETVLKIKNRFDNIRIQEHDKFILACAIAYKCTKIITLDKNICNEKEQIAIISKEINDYKIKINNPIHENSKIRKKFKKKRKKQ